MLVGDHAGVGVRRVAPTDGDQRRAGGHFLDRLGDEAMERMIGGDLLIVVQHQRGAGRQAGEQFPEETSTEAGDVTQVLRREKGQRSAFHGLEGGHRQPEVVEERREVRIAGIHLEPGTHQPTILEPGGHERRLARTRRADDADGAASFAGFVEKAEEALPREDVVKAGAGELRKQRRGGWRHGLLSGAFLFLFDGCGRG